MFYPYVQNISYQDPLTLFSHFHQQWGAVLLDSAQLMANCGRYSFIGVDPFLRQICKNEVQDPFQLLTENLAKYSLHCHQGLPPFQGGVIGFFSYDLYRYLEKIPLHAEDDMQFPDMILGFYDLVIAFDNDLREAWIFSSGYPLKEKFARQERARLRLAWLTSEINNALKNMTSVIRENSQRIKSINIPRSNIKSNYSSESYQDAVKKVIQYILEGDIFEANISQRFHAQLPDSILPFDLYCRLRALNPAPFAAYLNFGDTVLASASPERFLQLHNGEIESRPIKGTRKRGQSETEDTQLANELFTSEKDRAENIMIVDLLRNDLSRVCEDHSVKVPQLCGLESYATVHHLVSIVKGKLKQGLNAVDVLRATFPGGSITGAPKIRAMEIIAEVESVARGPYCGSIGYIGFNGDMDTSITIRTYAIKNNIVTFQAGGAVVLDSDPLAEYEETLTKAKALKKALVGC